MTNHLESTSPVVHYMKDFTAGWIGGIAQVLVGQPFDTIKVRLQTQSKAYNGVFDCVMKLMQKEGITGFYKGTLMPLLGIGLCVSIQFSALEAMKRFLKSSNPNPSDPLTSTQLFLCGSAAGLANTIVACPVEHVRIRCQVANLAQSTAASVSTTQPSGPLDFIKLIVSKNGVSGLFKGQIPTIVRDGLGFGSYFLVYEYMVQRAVSYNRLANPSYERNLLPSYQLITFGALSGIAFWLTVYPVDVIKSKIQTDSLDPSKQLYRGSMDCLRKTWSVDGLKGLFKGFTPCILRSAPVNAATFVTFEMAMRWLGKNSNVEAPSIKASINNSI